MPEEGFYFVTHTPAQAKKWEDLCASDPERVTRVIRLQYGDPPTSDGDTVADIFPAMEALSNISRGKVFGGPPDPLWAPLVDSGVVDALCKCVLQLVTQLSPLPTMPQALITKALNDVCPIAFLFPSVFGPLFISSPSLHRFLYKLEGL